MGALEIDEANCNVRREGRRKIGILFGFWNEKLFRQGRRSGGTKKKQVPRVARNDKDLFSVLPRSFSGEDFF